VPDVGLYLNLYAAAKRGEQVAFPYPNPALRTPLMYVNGLYYGHWHRYLYDAETLTTLLADAGFKDIVQAKFREGRDSRLLLDTPGRAVESLYIEGRA
jgi:hypothetical protein